MTALPASGVKDIPNADASDKEAFTEHEWLEEDHRNPAKAEQKRRRQIPLNDEPIGGG